MRRQRTRDTRPELELRQRLHAAGLRYRVDTAVVGTGRRRHDVVFIGARLLVDVRGCFWHGCPDHGSLPVANRDWWRAKLARNIERDAEAEQLAQEAGWQVLVVWEHEDPDDAALRVEDAIRRTVIGPARARRDRGSSRLLQR